MAFLGLQVCDWSQWWTVWRKSTSYRRVRQHRCHKILPSWRWLWKAQFGHVVFVRSVHVTHFPKPVLVNPISRLDSKTNLPMGNIHWIGHKYSFWLRTNYYAVAYWKYSERLSCRRQMFTFQAMILNICGFHIQFSCVMKINKSLSHSHNVLSKPRTRSKYTYSKQCHWQDRWSTINIDE